MESNFLEGALTPRRGICGTTAKDGRISGISSQCSTTSGG